MCLSHSFLKAGLMVDDWRQQEVVEFISNEKVMQRGKGEANCQQKQTSPFSLGLGLTWNLCIKIGLTD